MKSQLAQKIKAKMPEYLGILGNLVRIPSISFDNFDQKYVLQSAEAVRDLFAKAGYTNIQFLVPPSGRPTVYAESLTSPEKPTILLYAHHDVQPTMREALWNTKPFEPVLKENRFYGRGTADDKAGIVIHLAATEQIREMLGSKGPNLKFIIEGEEESGSAGFAQILKENKDLLKADAVIIADLGNFAKDTPSITTTLRGMSAVGVTLKATKAPLHSGSWSGPIPDPAQALCKMISSLTDDKGRILIPHYEDTVVPPTEEDIASYKSLGMTEKIFRNDGGVLDGVKLYVPEDEILISLWRRPSITVTAFESGSRTNAGNVLQDSAYARIGIRLAPGMDADIATSQLIEFLKSKVPAGLQCVFQPEDGANPFTTDTSHPFFQKLNNAMTEAYGSPTKIIGCGASIPGAELFRNTLGDIPVLMTGVEDPECNAHGENESLYLPDFERGILAEALFFASL
ncbi:MAG: M20/M25/M40 family metallo-hydrolase [Fibrobacteraceae bacterium]|nr:M20/M25/M40 family metallo-hydrolase [Fibrobacteraceae bacterium]